MRNAAYRLTFGSADFVCAVGKLFGTCGPFFSTKKKATQQGWPKGKSGVLKGACSADERDYPQAWPGSEINSDYAVDSQSPHCDEAYDRTAGIPRTRTVRLDFCFYSTH
jgi:hypothetical protein